MPFLSHAPQREDAVGVGGGQRRLTLELLSAPPPLSVSDLWCPFQGRVAAAWADATSAGGRTKEETAGKKATAVEEWTPEEEQEVLGGSSAGSFDW